MRGNLNRTNLPAIIRDFYAERKSGVLHFSCQPGPRRIFFRQGRIVRVESDAERDRFGEELVTTGRLRRAELNAALQLATRDGTSVGGALVKLHCLTAEELREAETRRMSEIVHTLLALTAGEFRFEKAENPVPTEDALEIPAEQVILDGVRHIADAALLRSLVGDSRALLRTTSSSALPVFKMKMTPAERGLLETTRTRQTVSTGELLSGSGLGEVDALRAVYALLSIGLLEVEETTNTLPLGAIEKSESSAEARVKAAPPAEATPQRLGRFEIQRHLARSSTGEVFRGRDPDIDRIVAIKVLDYTAVLTAGALEKYLESFQREFDRARQLHHPGIVAILETGRTEEGRPFLVTEYVQGTTLQDLLPSGPLATKHALDLANQILDAIAHAHSRGIVHRRVKPRNVLVTADGRVKVKGFGLPRLAEADLSESLPYRSPEQIATGNADARADVFSFGVVCYRMLTGALPFPEDSFETVVRALRPIDEPAPLEKYGSEFPPRLSKILLRCLARDPLARFADAGELKKALSALDRPTPADEKVPPIAGRPTVPAIAPSPQPARVTRRPNVSPTPAEPTPTQKAAPAGTTETPSAPAPVAATAEPAPRAHRKELNRRSPERVSEKVRPAAPQRRTRRWIWALAAAATLMTALAVGAAWTWIDREEPPWKELPSAPASDVSVTPVPFSPPSEEVLAALLAGPSDEAIFADANSALARGDLDGSRSLLMELLGRNPDFPGARPFLEQVEAERRKAAERRRRPAEVKPEPQPVAARGPSDAELFSEAESALARGELAVSRMKLDALLAINPGFAGAAELRERLEHRIWTKTLPRNFAARHNHRIGSCEGVLSLTYTGLNFRSTDHEWAWLYEELVSIDRPDAVNFEVVTSDRDLMGILSKKRFKFRLEEFFSDDDWRFFRKIVLEREPTPARQN